MLWEYWQAARWAGARDAVLRTAELFLDHRLVYPSTSGEVIDKAWLGIHDPPYWHYDFLQALVVLTRMGKVTDHRAEEGIGHLVGLRRPDGCWGVGRAWWRPPGSSRAGVEVVDWGRDGPNQMVTLNALRVLAGAGQLS